MKLKREFILREVVGENVLIPVGETALKFNGLITLNKVGAFIWNILSNVESEEEIVEAILNKYDVERHIANTDVSEFLDMLKNNDIID